MKLLPLAVLAAALAGAQTPPPAPAPRIPSYQDLKFAPLRPVAIPPVETYTLANGLRLYLLEDHELPLVSGVALIRAGNLFDPPDKIGLATMTGIVLRSGGTKSKTGNELDEQLENIAASVESSIGETSGQVSFSALRENIDEVLGILKDVLTAPEFRQERMDLAMTQLKSAISRRNDDPSGIAAREFNQLVYGRNTPYGWRMEYDTVNRIRRDDLLAFYGRYFFPANIMLGVYGDFSAPEMKARLERLFGGWNYRQPPVPPFPPVQAGPAPGVYLATKQDVNQTVFYLGHLGGLLRDKDDPALEIMADILGGGFSSRLFRKMRTERGYAYQVGADWAPDYDHPGVFEISGSTKSEVTTEALEIVRQEIQRIRAGEVSDDELQTAKQTVLNSFVFNFDRPSKTLARLLRYEYYGYPKDFIFQHQKAIAAVTKADVLRVAQKHINPADFTIVAVGNPQEFGKPLSALGLPVKPIDLTIPEPKPQVASVAPR